MKKTLKIFFMISLFILINISFVYASSHNVEALINREVMITYNSQILKFKNASGEDVYPISYNGTTYLPVRAISSLFKTQIMWSASTNSVILGEGELDNNALQVVTTFEKGYSDKIIALLNEDVNIYANGEKQTFKDVNGNVVLPISYDGTTYLPVRAISNLYDVNVIYDAPNNEVVLTKKIEEKTKKVVGPKATKTVEISDYFIGSDEQGFFINARTVTMGDNHYNLKDKMYCSKSDFEYIYAFKDYFDVVVSMKKRAYDAISKEISQADEYDVVSFYFKDKVGNKITDISYASIENYLFDVCGLPKPGDKMSVLKYKITDLKKDSYYDGDGYVSYQYFTYSNDKIDVKIYDFYRLPIANSKTYNMDIKCVKDIRYAGNLKLVEYRQEFIDATIVSKKDLK